ncbi:MAG TPA: hypothetical protein VK638_31570, partial [Edaphobacter sp.]|nr:hypothetical protein [Edaphobacter sp.]
MKLRPVLLVVLLLSGFYYVTTHSSSTGRLFPWLQHEHAPNSNLSTNMTSVNGPGGNFQLTEAAAAPAFDTEE